MSSSEFHLVRLVRLGLVSSWLFSCSASMHVVFESHKWWIWFKNLTFGDDFWSNTCIFEPTSTRLSKMSGVNLSILSPKDRVNGFKKVKCLELRTAIWKTSPLSRFSYAIWPTWKRVKYDDKTINLLLSSIRPKHNPLQKHSFKIEKSDDPYCQNGCKKLDTVDHISFKYNNYWLKPKLKPFVLQRN